MSFLLPKQVVIEKFPHKDFSIDQMEMTIDAGAQELLTLTWEPTEAADRREMILFKVDGIYRLQAILFGSVEEPPKPKKVL